MLHVTILRQYVMRHAPAMTGSFCIAAGLGCNKFVIEWLVADDGRISAIPVNVGILLLQLLLIAAGVLYIKRSYRILHALGTAFLLLFALQFWVRTLLAIPSPERRMFAELPKPPSLFDAGWAYQDQISRYEQRFLQIKETVASEGIVGYIASENLRPEEAKFHLGVVRYTFAPIRIEQTTSHQFIVGNFLDFDREDFIIPEIGDIEPVKNFGNGVILFRRNASL